MTTTNPHNAIVLAAGLGLRMRPLTDDMPKPMVPVFGKPIIEYSFDTLRNAELSTAVVNVHYLPELLVAYAANVLGLNIQISDERDSLLETGGGIKKALPLLGSDPFYLLNGDSFWLEHNVSNLARLSEAWNDDKMDMLMLLADRERAVGYQGDGDFDLDQDGRLTRRASGTTAPHVYPGAALIHPRLFENAPEGRFSMNVLFDQMIAEGRLFGLPLEGQWLHVGTPEAIVEAEARMLEMGYER